MGRRNRVARRWVGPLLIAAGLFVLVVGAVETVEWARKDVAEAEVVTLELSRGGIKPRVRVEFTLPDGRVVTPLAEKHSTRRQVGDRLKVYYDAAHPEAQVSVNGWNGVLMMLIAGVFTMVGVLVAVNDFVVSPRDG